MPKSLTLENRWVPVRETKDVCGWLVPWEVNGFSEDAEASKSGGVFDLTSWSTLTLEGPDARDYLHRMSTANFKTVDPTRAIPGGFLTGRAGVISLGWFLADKDRFDFLVPPHLGERTKQHLEQFHFAEKLTICDTSSRWAVFGLWAPPELLVTELGVDKANPLELRTLRIEEIEGQAWRDDCRAALLWVRIKREHTQSWLEWLRSFGVALLGHRLFEYHRIRAGLAEAGVEATEKDILLEAAAERSVARNKGCYPGQEVIERIFTYGQVNRKILPVQWEGEPPEAGAPIALSADGAEAAQMVAWERDPLEAFRGVGLAYVKRGHWEYGGTWNGPGGLTAVLRK